MPKKKIILIEDDLSTIDIYQTILKKYGFEVEVFTTGRQALKKLKQIREKKTSRPDLFLIDLILPDMNGIELLEKIKACKETKNITCFILTNYSNKELKEAGFALQAERYILKADYTPRELAEIIKKDLG